MSKLKIVYDDEFIAPGYIMYLEEEKKFMKIYVGSYTGFLEFCIVARDQNVDTCDNEFREISIEVDKESGIYNATSKLYSQIENELIKTVDYARHGNSYFKIDKNDKNGIYSLIASRDIQNEHASDYAHIMLGDHVVCKKWFQINAFYQEIAKISKKEEEPVQKVLKFFEK